MNNQAFSKQDGADVSEAELLLVKVQVFVLVLLKITGHGHCCEKHQEKEHGYDGFRLHDVRETVVGWSVE